MDEKEKRVLITGIAGFLGRHLARIMLASGWHVEGIVRPQTDVSKIPIDVRRRIVLHVHDSAHSMQKILSASAPHVVCHLAAYYVASHSPSDIAPLIESNIRFGTELFEAMAKNGVHNLVYAGTSWQHYHNAPYSPVNLYAATKEALLDILCYYKEVAKFSCIQLSLFDTYGEDDTRKKLFFQLNNAAETGIPLAMSAGEQKIDLVHIDDAAEAFHLACEYLCAGKTELAGEYAVTSGHAISLREVVLRYEKLCGKKIPVHWGARPYREREVMQPWNTGKTLPGWTLRHRDFY